MSILGTSKGFVESIYSIEAVKIEVFFISLNESSPKRSTFKMLKLSLIHSKNWDNEEGREYLFQQHFNCR